MIFTIRNIGMFPRYDFWPEGKDARMRKIGSFNFLDITIYFLVLDASEAACTPTALLYYIYDPTFYNQTESNNLC